MDGTRLLAHRIVLRAEGGGKLFQRQALRQQRCGPAFCGRQVECRKQQAGVDHRCEIGVMEKQRHDRMQTIHVSLPPNLHIWKLVRA
jgi:hypothetical protein